LLAAPLLLASCFCLALHPLYAPEAAVFDPALLGVWVDVDLAEEWAADSVGVGSYEFTAAEEGAYLLTQTDADGAVSSFSARLVELDGARFLDLFPEQQEIATTGLYAAQLFPVHQFFLVEQVEPELIVREMSYQWLAEHLAADPGALKHEMVELGDGQPFVVLTASTAELQAFYAAHVATEGAYADYPDQVRYVKVAEAAETPGE
jgi:hypothetical protein